MMVLLVGLAVLVGSGAYALMRGSGVQNGQPQSVVARQSPKPPSTITFTPTSVETLPPVATSTPAPLPVGDAGEEQTPRAQGIVAPYDPSWTPAPLPDNLEMRGNCLVLKSAVEVFPEDAVAAGGRVFDIPYPPGGRAYSLPDGRCITFLGDSSPPDWLPPDFLTPEPPPEATPTGEAKGPVVPAAPGCPGCRVKASDQLPVEAKDIQVGADGKYFIPDRGDGCLYRETARGQSPEGGQSVALWAPGCEVGWRFDLATGELHPMIA